MPGPSYARVVAARPGFRSIARRSALRETRRRVPATKTQKVHQASPARRCHAPRKMKDWEIIADRLSKAGWSWGCVSAIDSNGRTIWIANAHRGDGKRVAVRTDEKLTVCRTRSAFSLAAIAAPTSISAQKFPLCRQEDVCIQFGDQTHVRFS